MSVSIAHSIEQAIPTITAVRIEHWGRRLTLLATSEPAHPETRRIVFHDCRDIRWISYGDPYGDSIANEADVIGFDEGESEHRQPAVLTTDLFELSLLYGSYDFYTG